MLLIVSGERFESTLQVRCKRTNREALRFPNARGRGAGTLYAMPQAEHMDPHPVAVLSDEIDFDRVAGAREGETKHSTDRVAVLDHGILTVEGRFCV